MGSTKHCLCFNTHLVVCRGAALEHSEVHLDTHSWKWSYSNVILHPNPLPYTTLPLTQPLLWAFQRGWGSAWAPTAHIHRYTYTNPREKCCLLMRSKTSLPPALFSPLTAPSQKNMEDTVVTETLQENKFKDFPKAKVSVAWETLKA